MANKDVVKRLRNLKSEGYEYRLQKGHYQVWPDLERVDELRSEGFDVASMPGFVVVGSTPSDTRSLKNFESTLRLIGVGVGPSRKERRVAVRERMKLEDSDARLMEVLTNEGRHGLTVPELCVLLDWPYGRVYPRLNALQKEGKLSKGWMRLPVKHHEHSSRIRESVVWLSADLVKKGCFGSSGSAELTSFPEKVKETSLEVARELFAPKTDSASFEESVSAPPPPSAPSLVGATGFIKVNHDLQHPADDLSRPVLDARDLIKMFLDLPMSVLLAPELREDLRDLRKVLGSE